MIKVIEDYGYQTACLILAGISLSPGLAATLYFPAKKLSAGVKGEIKNERGIEKTESSTQSDLCEIDTSVKEESSITHSENTLLISGRIEAIHDSYNTVPKGKAPSNQAPTQQTIHNHTDMLDASGGQSPEETDGETPSSKHNCLNRMLRIVLSSSALQALRSPTFLVLVSALMGKRVAASFFPYVVSLYGEKGIPYDQSSSILVVGSSMRIVLAPAFGAVYSIARVRPFVKHIYASMTCLYGVLVISMAFGDSIEVYIVIDLLMQFAKSGFNGNLSGIIVDLFGLEKMLDYMAVARVFQGVALFAGPYFAGTLSFFLYYVFTNI